MHWVPNNIFAPTHYILQSIRFGTPKTEREREVNESHPLWSSVTIRHSYLFVVLLTGYALHDSKGRSLVVVQLLGRTFVLEVGVAT